MSHHATTVPEITNLQECQYTLLKWYIYCITIRMNFNPVDTVYWSVYAPRNIKSLFQVCGCRRLATRPNAVRQLPEEDTVVWDSGKYCCQPIHLNHIMEVSFPWEPGARCHSGCSGVAPLSLVVSVSGKNSPGSEGMQGWRRWWAEGLLFGMAHVFHLLGNSYGSLCNHRSLLCAATWLLCCDGVGVAERWGCQ